MRRILILLAIAATAHGARAQAVMMPANADMRAMQAPVDWEGSRAQKSQEADPDAAKWSADAVVPPPQVVVQPQGVPAPTAASAQGTPDFRVDVWDKDDHLVETMAHCATLAIGKAAFKEAARERPGRRVTLRRDALLVASREATAR